ncbi:uncharacterized protein LOC143277866 [Babylonia areolata]|uniref:uncharacterized protein LOC143277866 n=1 Tax=Babylonia areolata TaxID=304850 RepID=UPI003FD1ED18
MKYLYRVCWVRPYYALLALLGLCVLTVMVSLLYLEDAALKLPHTRLHAAAPLLSRSLPSHRHGAQEGPALPPHREAEGGGGGGWGGGRKDNAVVDSGIGIGVGGGGGFQVEKRNADVAEKAKDSGMVDGQGQRQSWPDHKKEARRIAGMGQAPGAKDIRVLNNLEIVVQNLSLASGSGSHHHHHHQQKESARLGIVYRDGKIVIPPHLLNARSEPSSSSPPRQRYIIYLCTGNMTCCGWGDRQHGILSAYLISLVTNRTFGVDMSIPCPIGMLFHPRIVDWKINASALVGLSSRHIYSVNDVVFRQVMQSVDFDAVYPEDVVYLTTNYDYFYALKANPHYTQVFRKRMHGKPRPLIFADLWQNIFKLNKRVRRRIDQALRLARPTKRHKLVCGHVRLGKNPSIPNDSEVRNTLQTIRPLWNFLNHFRDPRKYRIFVPSDSEVVRAKVLDMFPGQAVDVKGEIMHIDKSRVVEDTCVAFEKVLADQYLLSMCDVLVLTYSVFGKSAAYMRRSNQDLYFMENGSINPLQLFKEKSPAVVN